MSREFNAIVLDDDEARVAKIMAIMPDYINAVASRFVKDAQKLIAREDGTITDLLIMYADDPRAISLYIFDWMKKDSDHLGLRRVPVVIYTDDEFSDRVMEFLEIDDVFIHEGEVDDRDFFSLLLEAIDSIEEYDDEFYDANYPDGGVSEKAAELETDNNDTDDVIDKLIKNNPEKLMGLVINAPGGDSPKRSMLINSEDQLKSVLESIKTSKEKSYQLRLILEETSQDKFAREQIAKNYYSQDLSKNDDNSVLNKALEKIGSLSDTITEIPRSYDHDVNTAEESHIIDVNRYNTEIPDDNAKVAPSNKKYSTKKVSLANIFTNDQSKAASKAASQNKVKKVLVVDTDVRTKLSLNYHYSGMLDVDYADSSMKAIDYFIQNKPDIVLIEYDMPYVNGIMILDSIRRQPNGANVKALILLDVTKHNDLVPLLSSRPGVNGVIYKPFVKEQFIGAMQRCL